MPHIYDRERQRSHLHPKGGNVLYISLPIYPSVLGEASRDAQGAHASGSNNIGNIGICLLGNFVAQPARGRDYAVAQSVESAQLDALTELVDQLRNSYAIESSNVYGHKELKNTECPGPALSRWVASYRRAKS